MDHLQLIAILAVAVVSYVVLQWRRHPPYPPGPKGLPLLGAALIHPKQEFWKTYAEWDKQYGGNGIISFHVNGRRLVVVNSARTADDLLSKRSPNYSDRPFPTMGGVLCDRAKSIFYISYNERLKTYRRLLQKAFNPSASQAYWDLQNQETLVMIDNTLKRPEKLLDHIRRNAAAIVLKLGFGYDVKGDDDQLVKLAEETIALGSMSGAPGRWLVDSFPILRFLPDWMPGADFKRKAKEWGRRMYAQSLVAHQYVKDQMAAGKAYPSFTASLLTTEDGKPIDADMEDIVLWTAGGLYAAGSDTTRAAVTNFVIQMILHPEVQKKAQQEVDAFIARENRLPTCRDRPAFPYMEAILKENFRCLPPTPLGLAHCTTNDDVYEEYYIPAKTPILTNIWAIMHDEESYPDPFTFNPDRHLEGEGRTPQPDPLQHSFGFGRRVCPGRWVAENSVFIQSTLLMATVELSRPVDTKGNVVEPDLAFSTGIVSHADPFKYQIKERSPQAIALVRQALAAESST